MGLCLRRRVLAGIAVVFGVCGSACGGGRPATAPQSRCAGWLPPSDAARVLGAASVNIVTEETGATGHLDPGGVICEYQGFPIAQPNGTPSSVVVLDVWAHVRDAPRVYDDYVAGLSGHVTPVPGLGNAALSAPDVIVVRVRDSVFVIGGNDVSLAQQIAGRI
jgi:hypothetical protein